MSEDLTLAKDIIKPDGPEIGQFWRDTVNGDVLKIQEVSEYTPNVSPGVSPWKSLSLGKGGEIIREAWAEGEKPIEPEPKPADAPIPYVRCNSYPRGEYFMGVQEMKAAHFDTPRFQRCGWFKSLWYRWKFRRSRPMA